MGVMTLSENTEWLTAMLHELRWYWGELDVKKSLILRDLQSACASIDFCLNTLANTDSGIIFGAPIWRHDVFDQHERVEDAMCANCGVPFGGYLHTAEDITAHAYSSTNTRGPWRTMRLHRIEGIYSYFLVGERRTPHTYWAICTAECEAIFARKMTFHKERRHEEWEAIQKAQELLREARAWIRRYPERQEQA